MTPPHDLDAEMSVLGAAMDSPKAMSRVSEILEPEDFFRRTHQVIFASMLDLHLGGDHPDPVLVADHLRSKGELDPIGGAPYLHELLNAYPTAASAPRYAQVVSDKSRLRRLLEATDEIRDRVEDAEDVTRLIEDAETMIAAVSRKQLRDSALTSVRDALPKVLADLEERQGMTTPPGFSTGIGKLDSLIGGLHPGRYVVVGAATSTGKTSLLTQVAAQAAREGRKGLFVSLEMPRNEIIWRILAQESGVAVRSFSDPRLFSDDDWVGISKAAGDLPSSDILVVDDTATLRSFETRVRSAVMAFGRLDFVVVDYVQLLQGPRRKGASREEQVGEVSRALKRMSNQMRLTVLAASQLSREHERAGRRPNLGDLRESGSLAHDADLVVMFHRPKRDKDDPGLSTLVPTDLIVRKNRHGPTGETRVIFDAVTNRFGEDF